METLTFTFGDSGENHVGMEIIGDQVKIGSGFNYSDFIKAQEKLKDYKTELYNLSDLIDQPDKQTNKQIDEAYLLVVRNFLSEKEASLVYEENTKYEWDSKYFCTRRKKVLNKHARRNVMFADNAQIPDYENKKGTIIAWKDVPTLFTIRDRLPNYFSDKASNLICEGNRYYDIRKTGIGYHGDTERRKVIGLRIGATIPLKFKWWHRNKSIGKLLELDLNNGDLYLMSEKCTGNDWKRSSIKTIRHSAGCAKYTTIKK